MAALGLHAQQHRAARAGRLQQRGHAATQPAFIDGNVLEDAYQALMSVGHTPTDARDRLDKALAGGKRYKSVDELLLAIYNKANT